MSDADEVVARATVGRMERLGLRGYGGGWDGLHRTLGLNDADSMRAMRGSGLANAFTGLGWDFVTAGRNVSLIRHDAIDTVELWFAEHVTSAPGGTASLSDVRTSYADFLDSRRYKVAKKDRESITKRLDTAGFKRGRWKDGDGNNVTGYRDCVVTFDEGSPRYSIDLGLPPEPVTDGDVLRAVQALAGAVPPRELELAYAQLTSTHTRLCSICGQLSIRPKHRDC